MKRLFGFTLIELMITVAIVAILASVAISAWQNMSSGKVESVEQIDEKSIITY